MNRQLQARMLYAPYSEFKVGAAVLDERDRIHPGCNVENASLGLTVCAERAAIARAVCSGGRSIKAVLVFTDTEQPTPPCGACLQAIAELSRNPDIILATPTRTKRLKLSDSLPQRFVLKRD
jgi:cytidine deaminase